MTKSSIPAQPSTALALRPGQAITPRKHRLATIFGRKRSTLPEYLEQPEIEGLLKHAPSPQARLLMLLQWRAGLRVSEALALKVGELHLDGDRPTLTVRQGKGNRPRLVPMHPELQAALSNMLAFGVITHGWLVQTTRSTAWRWVRVAAAQAMANGDIAPGRHIGTHTLRHSAARHWLANGVPINKVSLWLGHANLQTTLIYLAIIPDAVGDMARVP